MSELGEGMVLTASGEEVDAKSFRVHRVLDSSIDPIWGAYNFAHLGFRNEGASYNRGAKHYSVHLDQDHDEKIVERFFYDVWNEAGDQLSIKVLFNFYLEDGTIGDSKEVIVKKYNRYKTETVMRERRSRQFDYMTASAKGTPLEPYIKMIMDHYSVEISSYKSYGDLTLDANMNAETNPTIAGILNGIPVPRNDGQGNTTVKRAIQYQIGSIPLEDL